MAKPAKSKKQIKVPKQPWVTVKIPTEAYAQTQDLLAAISQQGWKRVGTDKSETPTLGGVIAEAIKQLHKTIETTV